MHFAFHHANVAGCDAHNFLITSHDTDVVIVGVLAQACGHIGPNTAGPESLQVRQSTKGGGNFVDVNRVYQAICSNVPWKQDEQHIPDWFVSDEAKAILFVLVYFLAGCDFLPAFYNMPFPRMFSLVVETVCTPGLFDEAVVESKLDATGRKRWCVDTEQCVKMLAVCYFMLHWDCFSTHYPDGAAAMFKECNDVPTFVDKVRGIIFDAKGFNGKKQCPGFDALMFQSQRGDAVMEYWESSCAEKPWEVWFEARGWAKERPEEPFGRDNVVTVLSQHAILRRGGRVKVLLCTCDPQKSGVLVRKCKTCGCGQRNVACVPGYCKCQLKCRDGARVDTASAPPMTHGGECFSARRDCFCRVLTHGDMRWRGSPIPCREQRVRF